MGTRNDIHRHSLRGRAIRTWVVAATLTVTSIGFAAAEHEGMRGRKDAMEDHSMENRAQDQASMDPEEEASDQDSACSAAQSGGSGVTTPPPVLPGFPGAPRLYHLGATDFFLDHPEHITLAARQREVLEDIKSKAMSEQARYKQQIEEAENALWSLTGAESPDAAAIARKTQEIERLRSQQRMTYIQAVGAAANVLGDEQRRQLAGSAPPKPAPSNPPKSK